MSRYRFLIDDDSVIEKLANDTKRRKKADVMRDAISVYQYLAGRVAEGCRIYIGEDKNMAAELAITTLEELRPKSKSK